MTPRNKYIETQTQECRTRWFKEHVAEDLMRHFASGFTSLKPQDVIGVINWQKPGTWTYGCRYILHRRWLCIVGDIGEAIFEWSQDITPDFLLSLNFDYFMGKCQASPTGTKFEQWDNRVAWEAMKDCVGDEGNDLIAEATDDIKVSSAKEDYDAAARQYYDDFGDAETSGMIADFGTVPSVHAIGMFVGLQMALAQLKEAKV